MKKFLLFSALLFCAIGLFAQPANDFCTGAIPITPSPNGNGCASTFTLPFTTDGTTDSGLDNTCNGTNTGNDQFFTWTASALALLWNDLSPGNPGIAIYQNTGTIVAPACGPQVDCQGTFAGLDAVLSGWAINDNLIIQIFDFGTSFSDVAFCLELLTCPAPDGLSGTDITSSGVTAFWDNLGASSYIVEYGLDGFTPGTGNMIASADTFEMIGGLTAATDYDVYVKAVCGADSSNQDGPYSFQTLCVTYFPPYLEQFELNIAPTCWEEAGAGDPGSGPTSVGFGNWISDDFGNVVGGPNGDAAMINLDFSSDREWLISPIIDVTGGPFQVDFDIALTGTSSTDPDSLGSDDEVQLVISTDGRITWDTLMVWNSTSVISNTGEQVVVDLSAYTGTVELAFWANEGTVSDPGDRNFYVDNFFVRTPPTCIEVTDLGYRDSTSTTATLYWTADNPASTWKVEYGLTGFSLGSGTMELAADTFFDVMGLSPLTTYDFYVQEICGPGDSSFFEGPASFTTLPAGPPMRCGDILTPMDGDTIDNQVAFSFTVPMDADSVWVIAGQDPANLDTFTFARADTINLIYGILDLDSIYYLSIVPFNSAGAATGCPTITVKVKAPPPAVSGAVCSSGNLSPLFTESFDGTLPVGWGGSIGTGTTANTWNVRTGSTGSGGTGPSGAHAGSHYIYFESSTTSDTASMVSAPYDLSAIIDAVELEFYIHMFGVNGSARQMGDMLVEASSDSTNWSTLGEMTGLYNETEASPWFPVRYDLSSYAGQSTVYIRWTAEKFNVGGFNSDMAVDEVSIRTCVACAAPSALAANNVTPMTADLDWTPGGSEVDWLVSYGPAPSPAGAGTVVATTIDSLDLIGLTEGIDYDYHLRAVCGADSSPWVSGSFSTPLTPPANDDCATAILLTVNPDLNCGSFDSGTLAGSTPSADPEGCSGTFDDDIWYKFMATGTSHAIQANNIAGSTSDLVFQFAEGTCGSLTELDCHDTPNSGWTVTGLTIGNEYFVRVATWTSTGGQTTTFDICIGTPPLPPANDECAAAEMLTVNADLNCGSFASGTLLSATASADAEGCSGTFDDDVWYIFTAVSTSHAVQVSNQGGSTSDLVFQLSEGTCGALIELDCHDTPNSGWTFGGLVIGRDYYVRVASWTSTSGQTSTFDICIGTPPPPPANDSCSMAGVLMLSTPGLCDNVVSGTTVSASASPDACNTTNPSVWYTFTTTDSANYHFKATETEDYGSSTTYTTVYSGVCGSLTQLGTTCFSSTGVNVPLSPTTTYYVNVRSTSTSAGVDFDLCAFRIPDRPANDSCGGAFTLMESDITCNNISSGHTYNATPSVSADGSCSTAGKDVWYTFTPAATAEYNFSATETYDLSSSSTYVVVYDGTCGTFTQLSTSCSSTTGTSVMLTAATPYYVTVRSSSSTGGVFFDLCAYTCTPIVPDYIEIFDAFNGICWNEATDGTIATGPTGLGTGSWTGDDFGNIIGGPNGRCAKINPSGIHDDWLISPIFDLSAAGSHTLEFDLAASESFSSTLPAVWATTDTLFLLVSEDGGATWSEMTQWNSNSVPSLAGDHIDLDLAAYTSASTQFAYYMTTGGLNSPESVDVFVDNFEITYNAPCAAFLFVSGTPASGVFRAVDIVSDALIEAPKVVDFEGGTSIELNSNFEVKLGAEFSIEMVECP